MQNIIVHRYDNPAELGWTGYIEPKDLSWIAFIDLHGRPTFFLHRDQVTGAVLPSDPAKRAEALRIIRSPCPEAECGNYSDSFTGGPSRKPPSEYDEL